MQRIKNFIQKFHRNEKGVISIIVAISFVGLLLAILAMSIDLNRVQTSYNKNYNSTDAAALGTAEWWLASKVQKIGEVDNPLTFDPSQAAFEDYARAVLIQNFSLDQNSSRALDDESFKVEISKQNGQR